MWYDKSLKYTYSVASLSYFATISLFSSHKIFVVVLHLALLTTYNAIKPIKMFF